MSTKVSTGKSGESEPKLRHEFVGMMFAVAIGEVGLQTASLIQAGNVLHFLPAYFHLFLAACLIATSWVGWTLSQSPGARADVQNVFEWEFLLLMLDVLLVVVYFIIVKAVDLKGEKTVELNASAKPEALGVLAVFCLYLLWDVISKGPLYYSRKSSEPWARYGVRIGPTLICCALAFVTRRLVQDADPPHVLTADFALVSLVFFFRALKDLFSALFPGEAVENKELRSKRRWAMTWSTVFGLFLLLGILWTRFWPMFEPIASRIEARPIVEINHPEETGPVQQPGQ
jgi:hypothetical protein